ncbi:hypothetical protein C5S39_08095, partial [Candidatus Methanophagaceae archaeon]
ELLLRDHTTGTVQKEEMKMIGKNNITFHEEQQFRQVWIWILLLSISLLFISFMVQQLIVGRPFGVLLVFGVIFGFGFPLFFYILNLWKNGKGIQCKWQPRSATGIHRRKMSPNRFAKTRTA